MAFRDNSSPTARLIHADITPRIGGMKGITYGHAWIQDGDKLVDHTTVGTDVMDLIKGFDDMPEEFAGKVSSKSIFYGLADPKNIKSYDLKQMATMITKHKHWGPWPEQNMESKMELQLLPELTESRLYRATNGFKAYNQDDITELLFVFVLINTMFVQDASTVKFGKKYASKSTTYGKFIANRVTSTDLYQMAYFVNKKYDDLPKGAKKKTIKFDERRLWQYLQHISKGKKPNTTYLLRLQYQLGITNTALLAVRRLISDWKRLKYRQKQLAVTRLLHTMRAKAVRSELYKPLNDLARERKYVLPNVSNKELDKATNQSTLKRLAVAGATAYAAHELGPKITRGKLGPKASAGLAGIGAYWASKKKL